MCFKLERSTFLCSYMMLFVVTCNSVELKCPNTVPAKPSRSRVSRLAMISSIPHKANNGNNNVRSKEAKVICTNKNATPKAKVKGKESSKALTERKTKTQMQKQSPAAFRSVQNPTTTRVTPQNRLVAKALVFHSPNKLVKLKRSVEHFSSVKKLRKLGTDNQKNLKVETCKRPRKGREVKSRVFDSVGPKKQLMDEKAKGCGTLKQRVKGKEEPLPSSVPLKSHEANGVELENQPSKAEHVSDTVKQYQTEDKENALALEDVKREAVSVIKESGGEDRAKQYETREIEDKENASPFNKENADKESDDKENSSALDNNSSRCRKKKVFGKKETNQKVRTISSSMSSAIFFSYVIGYVLLIYFLLNQAMTIAADKCFNGKTVSANKYTKPKLTNPKPFRLRTNV